MTSDPTPPEDDRPAWIDLLQAETPPEEVHKRGAQKKDGSPVIGPDGQPLMLDYVTARFVQDRLDAAVGPTNWQNVFETVQTPAGHPAVRCGIGILPPESQSLTGGDRASAWVWKWDVGTPSSIEPEKGAHSDAFKRAGVQWGIARDLYGPRDEDRLVPAATTAQVAPAAQQAAPQGVPLQQQMQPQQGGPQVVTYEDSGGATAAGAPGWVCPVHDDQKIVPAGVSKRTGRPYNAFYACPVAGCDQKGPSVS